MFVAKSDFCLLFFVYHGDFALSGLNSENITNPNNNVCKNENYDIQFFIPREYLLTSPARFWEDAHVAHQFFRIDIRFQNRVPDHKMRKNIGHVTQV